MRVTKDETSTQKETNDRQTQTRRIELCKLDLSVTTHLPTQIIKKEFCALKLDALAKPSSDRSALKASGMQSVRSLARTHTVRVGAEALLCAHNIAVHCASLPMDLRCFFSFILFLGSGRLSSIVAQWVDDSGLD
jgi:hypothetical protein